MVKILPAAQRAHVAGKLLMAEGSRSQHDIGDLVNAQRGIESDKITDRKVRRGMRGRVWGEISASGM